MHFLRKYRLDVLVIAALWLLPLLLFWDVTLGGKTMLPVDNLFQWQPWRSYANEFGLTTPQNGLLSDLILQNYPWKRFAITSLQNGEIPLWSPQLFAGSPFIAKGQSSTYYPFGIIFYLMPLAAAYGWFTVSQLWLAGVGGYFFGRILKLSRGSSALIGLVYQGAGFILVSAAVFPMILGAAVWLPFLLGCIEMVIRVTSSPRGGGNTLPWAAGGATMLGIHLLAGHPEITAYTLLMMGLYAAWRLVGKVVTPQSSNGLPITDYRLPFKSRLTNILKPFTWLSIMVAVGLLMGAIQLLPLFEVGATNFRQESSTLAEVRGWAFKPRRILTLALPNFYGNPAHHEYEAVVGPLAGQTVPFELNYYGEPNPHGGGSSTWGIKNYVEGGIYLGILPLVLAGLGAWAALVSWRDESKSRERTVVLFFVALAFLSLNFIFGSPLYAIIYYLPFLSQLHSPFRWVFALSISVAVLVGFGAEYVFTAEAQRARRKELEREGWLVRLLAGLLVLSGGGLLVGLLGSRLAWGSVAGVFDGLVTGLAQAADAFDSAESFYSYLYPQLRNLGLVTLASGLIFYFRRTKPAVALAFCLIALDILFANRGFHAAVDASLLDFKPQMVQWLEAQPGQWRITGFEAHGDKPFNANSGWLFGFEDVRGYDSIIDKKYTQYMEKIEPQNELKFNRVQPLKNWESVNSPLVDLLGVKFIISAETLDLPKLQEVWSGEGLRIYENLAVVSRAYTIANSAAFRSAEPLGHVAQYDPRTTLEIFDADAGTQQPNPTPSSPTAATVTAYSNLEVMIDASVERDSWLVLNDSFADGWKAFVRPLGEGDSAETETPIALVNGNFRGVYLEDAGDYTVRFRYSPRSFILGGLGSVMAGIVIIFAFVVWGWRRYYHPEGELTNTQSIAKNSMAPMALNLFNKVIDFAFAMFYLRLLGPGESGAYATAIVTALWFDIVANWGLDALIIREVSAEKSRASHYLYNTTLLRLGTLFIGAIPVALFIGESYLSGDAMRPDIILAIVLIAIGMVFSGISKGFAGLFYVFESAEYPAALATVTTILKVGFGVFVLLAGWSFIGLAAVSIIVNIITLALMAYVAFRKFPLGGAYSFDWSLQKQALWVGWPLMLNHLLATVFFKIDQQLLYRINGEQVVGWYNSAYKWVDAFNIVPSFFTFALFPVIARQVNSNIKDARRTFRMSVKILVLVALPLAAIVTLLADTLIGTLGGPEFLPHGSISLRLVIWSIPIGWINSVTNYMIISLGMERRLTWGFIVAVLFNTIANIILLPRYGYIAAACTTIASELVLLIMFNRYLRERIEPVGWIALLWRPVLVTSVMVAAMLAAAQVSTLLALVCGIIIYPVGLFFLNVFGDEEKRIVSTILPKSIATRLNLGGDT